MKIWRHMDQIEGKMRRRRRRRYYSCLLNSIHGCQRGRGEVTHATSEFMSLSSRALLIRHLRLQVSVSHIQLCGQGTIVPI